MNEPTPDGKQEIVDHTLAGPRQSYIDWNLMDLVRFHRLRDTTYGRKVAA